MLRILHTADWHLGDRMGRIDRTQDLRRSVEKIAGYCEEEKADVLLVAGDIFSELSRPENLRETIEHLQQVFEPFLLKGGTILSLTGNHDNETFCQTLRSVMTLAAPISIQEGDVCPRGRLYLATHPTFLRLLDQDDQPNQFLLMPYPTPTRYLRNEENQKYGSFEEKNRRLQEAYSSQVQTFRKHKQFRRDEPTILSAHVHVQGAELPTLFRISEQESIIFSDEEIAEDFSYVALGHIHQPGSIRGMDHVRYSGSIERLDLGERFDEKGVTLFNLDSQGKMHDVESRPLPMTTMHDIEIFDPQNEIPHLAQNYPDAENALVRYHLHYKAGEDNLHQILSDLDRIFPRWYDRSWTEASELNDPLSIHETDPSAKSFRETVIDYLRDELTNHEYEEQAAILELAEDLLEEDES